MAGQTFGDPRAASPLYMMRLISPEGDTFYGAMPDHIQLSLSAPWEPPAGMSAAVEKLAGTKAGKVATHLTGGFSQTRMMTRLQWQGKEYLRLDIPFHFYAKADPDREVTNVSKQLLQFAAPDDFGALLIAPAGGGILEKAFTLEMGTFARFEDMILTNVSVDWQMRIHKSGHPMESLINIQLTGAYVLTKQYLERAIMSGGPSASTGAIRSGVTGAVEAGRSAISQVFRGR